MKPSARPGRSREVRRRVLLVTGVALLALGAWEGWQAATCFQDLSYRTARPLARTAQEDDATNPDWLDFFGRLDGAVAALLVASGGALLRWRCRPDR